MLFGPVKYYPVSVGFLVIDIITVLKLILVSRSHTTRKRLKLSLRSVFVFFFGSAFGCICIYIWKYYSVGL